MRRDKWPDSAGLVDYALRRTGTLVGVYRGADAGMDTCGGTEPWSTVCEAHGGILSHPTRALAMAHAPDVGDWCPSCMASPRCPCNGTLVLMWRTGVWACDTPRGCGNTWPTDVFPAPTIESGLL